MALKPHLQIFAPDQADHNSEATFTLFPHLPKELRQKIWRHSLQRTRLFRVYLRSQAHAASARHPRNTTPIAPNKDESYIAQVNGYQSLSKLFRVNSEAREVALSFYRVHLPCRLSGKPEGEYVALNIKEPAGTKDGILYINPEYDFLQITPQMPVKETLINFLYLLKTTYDPRGIGLLNLATDLNDLNANDLHRLHSGDLEPEVRVAFVETLAQLHEVFFVSTPRAGRHILGWLSGIPTSKTILNRSLPIMPLTPTFDRMPRDPRSVAEDLENVFLGTWDQRAPIPLWYRLLQTWSVSAPDIRYRFLLGFQPNERDQILDCESAEKFLLKEDDVWNGVERRSDSGNEVVVKLKKTSKKTGKEVRWPVGAEHKKYRNEDLTKAVRPAVGFWLFPVDALGPLKEEGVSQKEGFKHITKRLKDMTEYWPELALASLR
jgi:hypothetical protein